MDHLKIYPRWNQPKHPCKNIEAQKEMSHLNQPLILSEKSAGILFFRGVFFYWFNHSTSPFHHHLGNMFLPNHLKKILRYLCFFSVFSTQRSRSLGAHGSFLTLTPALAPALLASFVVPEVPESRVDLENLLGGRKTWIDRFLWWKGTKTHKDHVFLREGIKIQGIWAV